MQIKENTLKYKIKTNTGYKNFSGISCNGEQDVLEVIFDNDISIKCTSEHEIFVDWFESKPLSKLKVGDTVLSSNGFLKIVDIKSYGKELVYDVIDVDGVNRFYANDILVHNCQFIGKTGTLVESTTMSRLMEQTRNETYKFVIDGDIRFYKDLNKLSRYFISIDPAMGLEGDFSAIQVFSFPEFEQIAEWKGDKLNQNDQVEKLKILTEWMYTDLKTKQCKNPEIYWSLENNSVGEGFICSLREKSINKGLNKPQDYIKRATLINEIGNKRIGFTTNKRNKTVACAQLKNLLENNIMKIHSNEYVKELSNFTLKEVNYSANGNGEHDDLITSSLTIILMYLQCKNSLDLQTYIIGDSINIENNDKNYEMPFLFFNR